MLKNRKKLLYLVIPIVVVLGIVVLVQGVHAQTGIGAFFNPLEWFLLGIAWLIYGLVWLGGQLLLGLTVILIWVASYNNFINEPVVNVGWVIIRDLSNMVFIIALLYMAFNMVFGMKGKGGASLLTLIISAGLINFSKVIAGLFIDISQVIMLSFVHGFYNIAGGNLMEAFGLQNMLSLKAITNDAIPDTGGQASILTMIGTIILALIMVYIAIGLVLTIIIVLVGRILQLWGLLIFSPTPWVGKLVPGLSKFTGDWWDKLTKYCTSGPVLAFFLWLTFTAVDLYSKSGLAEPFGTAPLRETNQVGGIQGGTQVAGLSQAGSIQHMLSFIVIIGLLYLSLDYANKFGIMTAGFAGKVRKTGHKWTMKGLKGGGKFLGEHTPAGFGLGRLATKLGFEKTGKVLSTGILPGVRAAKDLAKEKFQILDKEKREQKKKLRTQAAKDALFSAYADVVEHKPSTEHAFRTTTLLGQASGEAEKLEKEGLLQGQGQAQHQLDLALRRGQEARAIGIAMHMAEKGWGDPEDMMKRIKERFKTGDRAETLISHRMEQKAGKAENSNKYVAPALSSSREDLDTGEISKADSATRIADAKELIDRGSFDDVDDNFAKDRRTFNFKRIANNKGEVEVRMGVIGEWASKVQAEADNLNNDPVQRRKWLQRWGSESRRKQVAAQLRAAVGIAEKNGVTIDPAKKEAIENMTRLFELENKDLYHETRGPGGKAVHHYNISQTLKSATATPGSLAAQLNTSKIGAVPTTKDLTDQVFDQSTPAGKVTATGPAVLTDEAQKETDKFYEGVLAQEEKLQRTADDRPSSNDAEIDQILRDEARVNATTRARLEDQFNRIQRLQRTISNGRAKTTAELKAISSRILAAQAEIRSLLTGLPTGLVDSSGATITADTAFDNSNLNDRLRLMEQNVQTMIGKATTGPGATGSYTLDKKDQRSMNTLAGGVIKPIDRSLNRRKEKQYKDDRSMIAGNNLLDRGTGALSGAKNTTVLADRVRQLEQARSQILAAINPRGPFLRKLQNKYRNDPAFKTEMNNLITRLKGLDFNVSTDRSDAEIEKITGEVSRLRNKYVK